MPVVLQLHVGRWSRGNMRMRMWDHMIEAHHNFGSCVLVVKALGDTALGCIPSLQCVGEAVEWVPASGLSNDGGWSRRQDDSSLQTHLRPKSVGMF